MNYIYLARRENVKSYTAYNDKITLLLKDDSFFYNNENFGKAVEGFFFQDILLYYSVDGVNTTIVNTNTNERYYIPNTFNADTLQSNTFLIGNNYERVRNTLFYSAEISLYQLNPYKFIRAFPHRYIFSQFIRNGNSLFTEKLKTTLSSISLLTGEYEWETPINRSGEIFKILGVRDNELVVCWQRGEKLFGLLGIEIQTGEIVWNIDNNQLLNGHSLYFTDNQQSLFSTKGTNHNSYFIEIDLLSKQAIRLGEIEELCKAQVEISRSQYKDGLIYFTASTHHDIFPDIIGVLDYKTLKVLWQHRFDFDRLTHLKNFEVSEDKLYVLDSKDTLHIFEKEQA